MQEMNLANEKKKEGFHFLYVWAIIDVLLIYFNLPILGLINEIFGEDETILHALAIFLPLVLLVLNIIIVRLCYKGTDRRIFIGCAVLIKYILVPFYAFGAFIMCFLFLMIFTPVVIMVFVSPVLITVMSIYGWCVVLSTAPFSIAYFLKAKKEGKIPKFLMKIGIASQFFFTFDVVAVMLFALIRERRWIKLTIVLLSLIAIVSFIVTCIIGYGILKAVL